MTQLLKFSVYGKILAAQRTEYAWRLFYAGDEGKMRPADDLVAPEFITEDQLIIFLSDICHEWASEKYPDVYKID
jgi:hypothetical protein